MYIFLFRTIPVLLFAGILSLVQPARGEIPGGVHWGLTDFPPFTITFGNHMGEGAVDRMIEYYIAHLSDHTQATFTGSLQRVLTEMQKGKHVCHGSLLLKKSREAFAEFGEPNMIQFANGVLTTHDKIELFKPFFVEPFVIDFRAMAQSANLKIRYHADRSYSEEIDKVIQEKQKWDNSSLIRKSGLKRTDQEIGLMFSGRLDGVIGRPEEGLYATRQLGLDSQQIVFLKIKGDKPYKFAQIACTKGAWNDDFMKDLNALTREVRLSETFMGYYMDWLPENLKKVYPELLRQAFQNR